MPDFLSLALALPAGAAGAAVGWFSARLNALLETDDDTPPIRGARLPWLRDPLVQSGLALCWALLMLTYGPTLVWLASAVMAVPLVQVTATDWRYRWVYLPVAGIGLLLGLLLGSLPHGAWQWQAPLFGALGGGGAFALLYGVGRAMYRGQEPLARGDIAIAAMVGAVGAQDAAIALMAGVLFSAGLAVFVAVTQRSLRVFMPYGPGLCLGGLLSLFLR